MPSRDPEKRRAQRKRWRDANPDKVLEIQRRYRAANGEKVRAAAREYYAKNKEIIVPKKVAYKKMWKERNPERFAEQLRMDYARNKDRYIARLKRYRDARFPGRVIRRLIKSFEDGHIQRHEFIEQSKREVDKVARRSRDMLRDHGFDGPADKGGGHTNEHSVSSGADDEND